MVDGGLVYGPDGRHRPSSGYKTRVSTRIGLPHFSEAPQVDEPWTAMQAAFRIGLRQPYRIAPRNVQLPLVRRMAATIPHVGTPGLRCGATIPDQ